MRAVLSGHRSAGITLIELMMTLAVVGILAAIAIPSYGQFQKAANRTDATKTLLYDAQALQRCYSQNFSYLAAPCPIVAGNTTSPNGFYTINVNITSSTQYTLTATPAKAPQTSDSSCASFTLQSNGQQSALNSAGAIDTSTCWGSN